MEIFNFWLHYNHRIEWILLGFYVLDQHVLYLYSAPFTLIALNKVQAVAFRSHLLSKQSILQEKIYQDIATAVTSNSEGLQRHTAHHLQHLITPTVKHGGGSFMLLYDPFVVVM